MSLAAFKSTQPLLTFAEFTQILENAKLLPSMIEIASAYANEWS